MSQTIGLGAQGKAVELLQGKLLENGIKVKVDGEFGPATLKAVKRFQEESNLEIDGIVGPKTWAALMRGEARNQVGPLNPAYEEAKKHEGKSEFDSKFNSYLSGFWKRVGLPNFKTIIGTSFAWCGLFVAAMNIEAGQEFLTKGARAREWAKYGVEIDWKKDGIPRGAVIHINGAGKCSSSEANHVTFADGDCTPEDLAKPGAAFSGFGGNQSNRVKRSIYPVKNLCAVRWPSEIEKPGKITKSVDCTGTPSNESTR